MQNRRNFLKISGTTALGLTLGSWSFANAMDFSGGAGTIKKPGLQLYSLRDDLPKDPADILKQVASFGYKTVESYEGKEGMFWGMGHKGFKKYLTSLGMDITSSHCNYKEDFERKAAEAAEIGMKYLICPYLGKQKSLDDYKHAAEDFNKAGAICKKNGIRFAYHNHDYSFRIQDGKYPQDVMMQHADPSLVDFEMDIYWVVTAGQDPTKWMQKYKNRFKLCHIKDRKKGLVWHEGEPNSSCIVGTGAINFPKILKVAKANGMAHYIVEQEAYEKTPLECVKADAAYIRKLKF